MYFLFLLYYNHNKFQVHVLKSLIEVQEYYKQKTHQKQTEEKLQNLKHKLNVGSDDELSEEERDSQKSDDLDNLSISELSESGGYMIFLIILLEPSSS